MTSETKNYTTYSSGSYTITITHHGVNPISLAEGIIPSIGTERGSFFDGKNKYWFFNLNLEQLKYEIDHINKNSKFLVKRIERLVDEESGSTALRRKSPTRKPCLVGEINFEVDTDNIDIVQIYPKLSNKHWSDTDTDILALTIGLK